MNCDLPPDQEVSLVEITADTLRPILNLKVHDRQRNFVADNATSIAQAHFESKAWFRAIHAGETPVGFVMLYDDVAEEKYFLWRLMVDGRYQGNGYGRLALDRLVDYVKGRPNGSSLMVSCVPGEGSPLPFYEKYGFVLTGEKMGEELVLKLDLAGR